jgi:ubiquitin-like protein Pup
MAKQTQKEKASTEEAQPEKKAKDIKGKGEDLKDEMDNLIEEIDAVLEENAEEFVKAYVQRGGE